MTRAQSLFARTNFTDPRRSPHAPKYYANLCAQLALGDTELDKLLARCDGNSSKVVTYLKAHALQFLTTNDLQEAANGGRLPCAIFLNEEIRKVEPRFARLNH